MPRLYRSTRPKFCGCYLFIYTYLYIFFKYRRLITCMLMFVIKTSHIWYFYYIFTVYFFVKIFTEIYNISLSVSLFISIIFSLLSLPPFRPAPFFKTDGLLSQHSFYGRICNFKLTGSRRTAMLRRRSPFKRGSRTVKFRGLFYCSLYGARYAESKRRMLLPIRH